MNRKAFLGLSAILFVIIAVSYLVGPYAIRALHIPGGSELRADDPLPPFPPQGLSSPSDLRADGEPLPPFPPQGLSAPSNLRADGEPLPPFPWGLSSLSDARLS